MAVNLLTALAFFAVSAVSLDLEPPEFLGPYTDEPARWPYGGCVEVSKIYPAPGSHLHPPLDKYAKNWNLTITVVFSRPVTRILWNYDIRIWLQDAPLLSNNSKFRDEVLSCAKQACLIFVHNGVRIHQKAVTAGPTERGNVFSDEYQFTFMVPTYVKDHVSEVYFALDGGWMYSPVYKFITNPNVEFVPYTIVRYLPPTRPDDSSSNSPPERDTNYWVNHPSTCAARGGLIHRPFIFSRTKRKQHMATTNTPRLLTELSKIVKTPNEGRLKLKLYYQIKQPGVHTIKFPDSIKLVDEKSKFNISFSVPAANSLIINFTSPRLYIPVAETKYVFDYRERAYYREPKWDAYFFTWKMKYLVACHNNASFDCNMFQYSKVLPKPSLQHHHFTSNALSDGYKLKGIESYGLNLLHYHQFNLPENKQFYKTIPRNLRNIYDFYYEFEDCYRHTKWYIKCYNSWFDRQTWTRILRQHNVTTLVLDPYWKLINIFEKYTGEVLDRFMISNELPKTVYKSEGISISSRDAPGMMQYGITGSLYEKDMSKVIPLLKHNKKFQPYLYIFQQRLLRFKCQSRFKRNVGKWGILKTFIEYGNMYRLHISKSSSNWTVQQTMSVKYSDKTGQKGTLDAAIVSIPEHIREAVERYAVLTNVEPSVSTASQSDARLKPTRESYPLEKAVFVPRELVDKHGCGTFHISKEDLKQIRADYYNKHGDAYNEHFCDKPPVDCTGLPADSLERFPFIPPFNILDLIGSVDPMDPTMQHHRRALYYRDNLVNDLFILNTPNSYYTGVVEISGVEVKEPQFAWKSCNDFWEFSPDRYDITKGHLTATITNMGEGGGDVVLSVHCTPKLVVHPGQATKVWVDPRQMKKVRLTLSGYPMETKQNDNNAIHKCIITATIDVTPFSSVNGKSFPICDLFVPTFSGSFVNPCDNHFDHDITYYHLPREFAHDLSLEIFLSSTVGKKYELLKMISIKLVKYHTIQLSFKNHDVLALTEDQLIISSMKDEFVGKDIELIYSTDKLLQERVYIFIRKFSSQDTETGCLLTLISSPFTPCGVLARKYIAITKADTRVAVVPQKEETTTDMVKSEESTTALNEEVLSAILVCLITSLVLIVLIITGNSLLFIYDKQKMPEKMIEQVKAEIRIVKQEHDEVWKNPRMYLKSGTLGPHYVLEKFKATTALDTTDLKMLKLSGVLKYREKELQVIVEYVDKIMVKKTFDGSKPDEIWLKASSGMYLLKQKNASEEYKEEFNSLLQRCMKRTTRGY